MKALKKYIMQKHGSKAADGVAPKEGGDGQAPAPKKKRKPMGGAAGSSGAPC